MTAHVSGVAGEDIAKHEVVRLAADGYFYAIPPEPKSNERVGELVIQSSEYCALSNRIKELEALVEKMKCCDNCSVHIGWPSHCPQFKGCGSNMTYQKWEPPK